MFGPWGCFSALKVFFTRKYKMSDAQRDSVRSEFIRLALHSWVQVMHGDSPDAAKRAKVQHECEFIEMIINTSMEFGEVWATSGPTINYVGVGNA